LVVLFRGLRVRQVRLYGVGGPLQRFESEAAILSNVLS
jgi:hypothetical protein